MLRSTIQHNLIISFEFCVHVVSVPPVSVVCTRLSNTLNIPGKDRDLFSIFFLYLRIQQWGVRSNFLRHFTRHRHYCTDFFVHYEGSSFVHVLY